MRNTKFLFAVLAMCAACIAAVHAQAQSELSKQRIVSVLRFVNTQELNFSGANHSYAQYNELIVYSKSHALADEEPVDISAQALSPYVLAITLSADGKHYSAELFRPTTQSQRETWCKPAGFTDERGLIYLGAAIGCETAPAGSK